MTTSAPAPVRLKDVVAEGRGTADDLDDHLSDQVAASQGAGALPASSRRSIDGQLRAGVDAVLARDVVSVLAEGWQTSQAVREAARETLTSPDVTQVVFLSRQSIGQKLHPSVHVYFGAQLIIEAELEIALTAEFLDVSLAVRKGKLTAIDFQRCELTLKVSTASGAQLVERSLPLTSNLRLPLPLPIPIPLGRSD